jgi:hypothetical protein
VTWKCFHNTIKRRGKGWNSKKFPPSVLKILFISTKKMFLSFVLTLDRWFGCSSRDSRDGDSVSRFRRTVTPSVTKPVTTSPVPQLLGCIVTTDLRAPIGIVCKDKIPPRSIQSDEKSWFGREPSDFLNRKKFFCCSFESTYLVEG